MNYQLNIAWFYPDLMSTYGDRGNIIVMQKRCEWRRIKVNIDKINLDSPDNLLNRSDLLFMGGAQDRQQKLVGQDFLSFKAPKVKAMIENNIPALFVCAAYQFAGHYYKPYQGEKIPGAGIFDLYTEHLGDQSKRLIGNVVAKLFLGHSLENLPAQAGGNLKDPRVKPACAGKPEDDNLFLNKTIVGFENHGGRTYLGKNILQLAKIIKGFGNNGEDGFEGAIYKNALGSYFHGPLLPKNPQLADWLIKKALEVKYGNQIKLERLNDDLEWQAHDFAKKLKD